MRRVLVLVAFATLHGCFCLPFPNPYEGFDASFAFPHLPDGGPLAFHSECAAPTTLTAEAFFKAAENPVTDGEVETLLSDNGCLRRVDRYAQGRRVATQLRAWSGTVVLLDERTQLYDEPDRLHLDATFSADGSSALRFDIEGDGTPEETIVETRAQGLLVARVTTFTEATGAVRRRETLTQLDAQRVQFVVEEVVDGALVETRRFEAANAQRQNASCYAAAPAGGRDTVPCPTDRAALEERVREAVRSFSSCLQQYGGTWSLAQLEAWRMNNRVEVTNIECFQADNYFGEALSDSNTLRINVGLLSMCEGDGFVNSTLVHEMLHFMRGPHDFDSPSGAYGPRARAGSDPMYACEELCYGTIKTRCSCARCLGVKACDDACAGLPECVVRNDAGVVTATEAVGSHCRADNSWFPTLADCKALDGGCSDPAHCKSYSVSCRRGCQ